MLGRTRTDFCESAPVLSSPVPANTPSFNKVTWDARPQGKKCLCLVQDATTHCGRGPFPEDSPKYFASWKEEVFPNCPVPTCYKASHLETWGTKLSPQFYLLFCAPFLFACGGWTEGPGSMCRGVAFLYKYFWSHLLSYQLQPYDTGRLSRRFPSLDSVVQHRLP